MRRARVKVEGNAHYHVMSRCALQHFLLTDDVKGMFLKMLRRAEYFSGVKIVNYCIMDNHFHLLVHVPEKREVSRDELDDRISVLYGEKKASRIQARWRALQETGAGAIAESEAAAFRRRMFDISEFMKTFKQRFSLWYCSNHGNLEGTIWQGPFHSVLVEGSHDALGAISTYITMNPVRAGIVKDPGRYAWSGYGAACQGDYDAKNALLSAVQSNATKAAKWKEHVEIIRRTLIEDEAGESQAGEAVGSEGAAVARATGKGNCAENAGAGGGDGKSQGKLVLATTAAAMKRREQAVSRGVAFGSEVFVRKAIADASTCQEILTYPKEFCVGGNTLLFCAGRRRA